MMVPSESCLLQSQWLNATIHEHGLYRKTIFASALAGAWTGVGHREMVWCHQVRWRIARTALAIASAPSTIGRQDAIDTWLSDGRTPPASSRPSLLKNDTELVSLRQHLALKSPRYTSTKTWLLPIPPTNDTHELVVFVSQGSIPPISPQNPIPLRATVSLCRGDGASSSAPSDECLSMVASAHKLIPNPAPGKSFPVPDEGSDESEGVVLFETDISASETGWAAVTLEGSDGRGWVVAGFTQDGGNTIFDSVSMLGE